MNAKLAKFKKLTSTQKGVWIAEGMFKSIRYRDKRYKWLKLTGPNSVHYGTIATIYTTKIDGVFCPPNISETVAVRTVKPAHRPRIASTTIKFISKPILLSTFINYIKTIKPIGADAKRKPSPPANHNLALRQLLEPSPIVCQRIVLYNETPGSAWTVSEANYTVPSYTF